jgi:hypothetical protein
MKNLILISIMAISTAHAADTLTIIEKDGTTKIVSYEEYFSGGSCPTQNCGVEPSKLQKIKKVMASWIK